MIHDLLLGALVDSEDEHGLTPLMTAVEAGYPLIIYQLLKAAANTNIVTSLSFTALHFAAKRGDDGIVNMLLSKGANPNIRTVSTSDSPLSIAVTSGHVAVVTTLLQGSTYVDPQQYAMSLHNPQPLNKSVAMRQFRIAKLLFEAGYASVSELNDGLRCINAESVEALPRSEQEAYHFLKTHGSSTLSLEQKCRQVIRKCLERKICDKVNLLGLPPSMQDYVTYRYSFTPISLESEREIYNYFGM